MTTHCDHTIEILKATRDGDDLAPEHLKLIEIAVNGCLSPAGETAFRDLIDRVRSGYVKPWLHDVEHLTRDHHGYIYWKGIQIEHWSGPELLHGERGRTEAAKLAGRCRALESMGEPVTCRAVIWDWHLNSTVAATPV